MKTGIQLLTIALLALLLATCEKPERDNPWDEKNTLSPEAWAPQNFQIENVTITEKKLTWTFDDKNIEGFKLDRKKGDDPWQVAYQTFAKETRSYTDQEIIPETGLTYQYRLYTFAGKNKSAEETATASAAIPPPTNLQFTRNDISTVNLNWQDNSTGEEGFKVERKYETGDWIEMATTTGTSWQDNDFKLNTMVYYRVNAYFNQYSSAWLENSFDATIPPPENLTISINSISSVTLNWNYNMTGHEGFQVDRKRNSGVWEEFFAIVGNNLNTFSDNGVTCQTITDIYYYRVYTIFNNHTSSFIENSVDCPCGDTIAFNTFDASLENWTAISLIGAQKWERTFNFGIDYSPCMSISGFDGGANENEDWLISPAIDLSNTFSEKLSFYSAVGYSGPALKIKISTDYIGSGVPSNATWSDLTELALWPTSEPFWEWTNSGTIDISVFGEGTVYVAFVYNSTTQSAATWEVDNILISTSCSFGK